MYVAVQHTTTRCNTLQHAATQCNTRQHPTKHTHTLSLNLDDTATHCNTLQHPTKHIRTHSLNLNDLLDFWVELLSLLSDGDSIYSRETLFEILGTPKKMLIVEAL